jgi:hypothetical protein
MGDNQSRELTPEEQVIFNFLISLPCIQGQSMVRHCIVTWYPEHKWYYNVCSPGTKIDKLFPFITDKAYLATCVLKVLDEDMINRTCNHGFGNIHDLKMICPKCEPFSVTVGVMYKENPQQVFPVMSFNGTTSFQSIYKAMYESNDKYFLKYLQKTKQKVCTYNRHDNKTMYQLRPLHVELAESSIPKRDITAKNSSDVLPPPYEYPPPYEP